MAAPATLARPAADPKGSSATVAAAAPAGDGFDGASTPAPLPPPPPPDQPQIVTQSEPGDRVPDDVATLVDHYNLGQEHFRWHTVRLFDLTEQQAKASGNYQPLTEAWEEAHQNHWDIPARQEGDPGNGLDFLAMHHDMVQMMKAHFREEPDVARLFDGWQKLPAAVAWPYDPNDPDVHPADADQVVQALNNLVLNRDLGPFKGMTDDAFGRFIQSAVNSLDDAPAGLKSGIHGYMHNQYEVPGSGIEMDDFVNNLKNIHFWGLHGFIDRAWMTFRKLNHLSPDDSSYVQALDEQAKEMGMPPPSTYRGASRTEEMSMPTVLPDGTVVHADGTRIPKEIPQDLLSFMSSLEAGTGRM